MPAKQPTPRPFRPTSPDPALLDRGEVLRYLDSDEVRELEFSTSEVHSVFPRVTLRMLQWWDEAKIISPSFGHYKHQRHYGVADLIRIGVADELRNRGFSLWRIRPIVKRLDLRLNAWRRGRMPDPFGELLIVTPRAIPAPPPGDHHRHEYMDDEAQAVDFIKQQRGPAYAIGTADLARRIMRWIDQTDHKRQGSRPRR